MMNNYGSFSPEGRKAVLLVITKSFAQKIEAKLFFVMN